MCRNRISEVNDCVWTGYLMDGAAPWRCGAGEQEGYELKQPDEHDRRRGLEKMQFPSVPDDERYQSHLRQGLGAQ
jgi:hypothetical protein